MIKTPFFLENRKRHLSVKASAKPRYLGRIEDLKLKEAKESMLEATGGEA